MATSERAEDFMRSFRLVHFDTHCDREDCHGTHIDRIKWEIALRRTAELGTLDVIAELDDDDRHLLLWVAYVAYVREKYTGRSSLVPPPSRRDTTVIIPKGVADSGLDQEAVENICWLCDDPDCRICNWSEGDNRIQRFVLRERGILSRLNALNDERHMTAFFDELDRRVQADA